VDFQRKPIAWQVCDRILATKGLNEQAYYFAANTVLSQLFLLYLVFGPFSPTQPPVCYTTFSAAIENPIRLQGAEKQPHGV